MSSSVLEALVAGGVVAIIAGGAYAGINAYSPDRDSSEQMREVGQQVENWVVAHPLESSALFEEELSYKELAQEVAGKETNLTGIAESPVWFRMLPDGNFEMCVQNSEDSFRNFYVYSSGDDMVRSGRHCE